MTQKRRSPNPKASIKAPAQKAKATLESNQVDALSAVVPEVLPAEPSPGSSKKPRAQKTGQRARVSSYRDLDPSEDSENQESESEADSADSESDEFEEPTDGEWMDRESESLPVSKEQPPLPTEIPDSDLAAISPTDPLRRYFDEVKQYPLLSAEEELDLADRMLNQGDINAAKKLVSANLRLVVKIAFEYRSFYSNVLDLIQEGNIGLMKAVSKFDPSKGARLGYYSSWWIRSYILKYLLDNFRLVKIGTTQAQKKLFYHLMREKERLEAQGLLAGPKLLAEKLNVREKDVVEMEHRLSGRGAEVSLDTPVDSSEEGTRSHLDFVADQQVGADDLLARNEILNLLRTKLPEFEKILNEKERILLQDRLLSEEPKTLQEVADLYGLTRERARQIEAKVIAKLRDYLKSAL